MSVNYFRGFIPHNFWIKNLTRLLLHIHEVQTQKCFNNTKLQTRKIATPNFISQITIINK